MQITIDTATPLSAADKTLLRSLLDSEAPHSARLSKSLQDAAEEAKAGKEPEVVPVEEPEPQPRRTPRRKPAPKPAPEPEPEPEDDETEDGEDEAEDDDLIGGAPTLDQAVAQATELVGAGKGAQVKAALASAGAKKVSELKGKAIAQFLAALAESEDD